MQEQKIVSNIMSVDSILKIDLGARACQSYLLICKNAHFSIGLQTEKGNVSTYSHAISKWIKLELPYWSLIEGFFKSFLTLHIFN